jgi:hypothetical protein
MGRPEFSGLSQPTLKVLSTAPSEKSVLNLLAFLPSGNQLVGLSEVVKAKFLK